MLKTLSAHQPLPISMTPQIIRMKVPEGLVKYMHQETRFQFDVSNDGIINPRMKGFTCHGHKGQKFCWCSNLVALLIISVFLSTTVLANSYSQTISAGNQSWSVERQTQTLTFSLEGDVSGSITPIEITPFGRNIKNVASRYSSMTVNDVGSKEKVSAREGRIILKDKKNLMSSDMLKIDDLDSNYIARSKFRAGLLHAESYELWPVIFKSASLVKYKGLGINDWDYKMNTYDGFGENSLYNKNYQKSLYINTSLIRFNTSVDASDSGIIARLLPTKSIEYKLTANTSGITDLYSRILDSNYDPKHRIYPDSIRILERYAGDYGINRSITYQTYYEQSGESDPWYDKEDTWLPCCQPDENQEGPQIYENPSEGNKFIGARMND